MIWPKFGLAHPNFVVEARDRVRHFRAAAAGTNWASRLFAAVLLPEIPGHGGDGAYSRAMAAVRVSTERFASMLANRGLDISRFREELESEVDVASLLKADLALDFDDVRALAKRFKVPWPYLLIDEGETPISKPRDNRTLLNQRIPLSADLVGQIAAVEAMLEAASELFPEVSVEPPLVAFSTSMTASKAADVVRTFLRVSARDQFSSSSEYASLGLWSAALQARGVYVSMRRLEDESVRAFSLARGEQAVVVADTQDTPYARSFSLLHEYTHVLLRTAGICDLDDHTTLERFCNRVAANVLMPRELVLREVRGHEWGASEVEDERVLQRTSRRLGASQASLLIRLVELGVLPQFEYEALEARRAERRDETKKKGGQYYPTAIGRVGRRFAGKVVGALEIGSIDRQEASVLLELPEHNLDRFRSELGLVGAK
jgi:Zn-dependent peptidase ImmA (M78 family)